VAAKARAPARAGVHHQKLARGRQIGAAVDMGRNSGQRDADGALQGGDQEDQVNLAAQSCSP